MPVIYEEILPRAQEEKTSYRVESKHDLRINKASCVVTQNVCVYNATESRYPPVVCSLLKLKSLTTSTTEYNIISEVNDEPCKHWAYI